MEYAIIVFISITLTLLLSKETIKKVDVTEGDYRILKPSRIYRSIAWFFFAAGILMVTLVSIRLNNPYSLLEVIGISIFAILLCGITGYYLVLFTRNHFIKFNDEEIIVSNWLGKTSGIRWDQIDKIKFNPLVSYLRFYGLGRKLSVHKHVVGLRELVKMIEQKTDYTAKGLGIPVK